LPALERIFERGQANGVRCEMIDRARLAELEPHAAGVRAIHVPETGIVNYRQACVRLAARIVERGGRIVTGARVFAIHERSDRVVLETTVGEFDAALVVNCAGLYSDRVTAMSVQPADVKIVPFRGEYYALRPEARHLVRNLIYPVPDPSFPFLGVHFTRLIEGGVECGPNAVLAFAREGYNKTDVNLRDLAESLTYSGFLRLAAKYWRTGLGEMWRSWSKAAFVRALERLLPEIRAEYLEPAPSGVRAQALTPSGELVDDFLIRESGRVINVQNAPSPAATAALNIGRIIVDSLAARLQ
jgi:L-2-hydroxyglutarate oxidase